MITLGEIRHAVVQQLLPLGDMAALEADLIICASCGITRTQCYAYPEREISAAQRDVVIGYVQRRLQGEPLAYIVGTKEFWSLPLQVTAATLIPRPETECLVEWVLANFAHNASLNIADLGTGSGAIAIALAKTCHAWQLHATDISQAAIEVATRNAKTHQLKNMELYCGHWCEALPRSDYDLIVTNPPYINECDPCLASLCYEPTQALVSGPKGLADISIIVSQADKRLSCGGWLAIEHGATQRSAVICLMERAGYAKIKGYDDLAGRPRFVVAMKQRT